MDGLLRLWGILIPSDLTWGRKRERGRQQKIFQNCGTINRHSDFLVAAGGALSSYDRQRRSGSLLLDWQLDRNYLLEWLRWEELNLSLARLCACSTSECDNISSLSKSSHQKAEIAKVWPTPAKELSFLGITFDTHCCDVLITVRTPTRGHHMWRTDDNTYTYKRAPHNEIKDNSLKYWGLVSEAHWEQTLRCTKSDGSQSFLIRFLALVEYHIKFNSERRDRILLWNKVVLSAKDLIKSVWWGCYRRSYWCHQGKVMKIWLSRSRSAKFDFRFCCYLFSKF